MAIQPGTVSGARCGIVTSVAVLVLWTESCRRRIVDRDLPQANGGPGSSRCMRTRRMTPANLRLSFPIDGSRLEKQSQSSLSPPARNQRFAVRRAPADTTTETAIEKRKANGTSRSATIKATATAIAPAQWYDSFRRWNSWRVDPTKSRPFVYPDTLDFS